MSDGTYNYQYNAEGQLVYWSAIQGSLWGSAIYNALGERMTDTMPDGTANRTLIYPWDIFGHRLEAFDDRPSQNWVGADQWWARVAGQRILMGGSTSWLRHADAVGTTTMVTDQTGAVDDDALYYPWGQVWKIAGGSNGNVFGDLGYQINYPLPPSATRDYNPTLGRWMVPDPGGVKVVNLSDPQTWNMYAYAGDNPTTFNDPTGLYFVVDSSDQGFFLNALATLYQRPGGRALVSALAASSKPVILDRSELSAGEGGVSRAMFNKAEPRAFAGVHVTVGTDSDLLKAALEAPGQVGPALTTGHELEHAEAGLTAGSAGLAAGAAAMAAGDKPVPGTIGNTLGGSAQTGANAIMSEKPEESKQAAKAAVQVILKSGNQQWLNNASRQSLCTQNNLHAPGCK